MARLSAPAQVSERLPHGRGGFVQGIRRSNRDFPDQAKPAKSSSSQRNYGKGPMGNQMSPAAFGNSGFGNTGVIPGGE